MKKFFFKGFNNKFGVDSALGLVEAKIGEWFHKIGVGLLKKKTNIVHLAKPRRLNRQSLKLKMKNTELERVVHQNFPLAIQWAEKR